MLSTLSETFNRHQKTRLNQKLLDAAAHGKTKKVIALIEKGADVNARDKREVRGRWTPLHWAATGQRCTLLNQRKKLCVTLHYLVEKQTACAMRGR